ncbi:MAG: ATP-binding protein [Kiritimatiellae bacterium]|nr:ATP-binding protein [Kiritimatiellia bacterium]
MKLLYLYFTYRSQFRRIFADGIEFNFDSEIRFKLDGGELKRIDSVGKLPKGFFSVLPEKQTPAAVDSVSVIAGGNGSGKTSLVEVLLDIREALDSSHSSHKFKEFIVVYCCGMGNECYYESNIPNLKTPDGVKRPAEAEVNNGFQDVPLVYVTPHFTPYVLVDTPDCPNSFSDLSTIGLMKAVNPQARDMWNIQRLDPIGPYQTEQTKWTLSFVRAEQELPPEKKLPLNEKLQDEGAGDQEPVFKPIGIRVSLSKVVAQKLRSKKTAEDVKRILKNTQSSEYDFFEKVFYAYAGLYVNERNSEICVQSAGKNDKNYCGNVCKRCLKYKDDLTDLFSGELPPRKEAILRFLRNQKKYQQKDYVNAVRAFFRKLGEILDLSHQQELANASLTGSIVLDMKSQEQFKRLLELVDLHFKAETIVPILDFDTVPRMSAGERAFFDTWGRLYHHFLESIEVRTSPQDGANLDPSDSQNWPGMKDAIIFFDEAETTMHPEWQRRIVQRTIWFFEAFAPWVHPHLIFATHSPILLSDVPAGNVVLLDKGKVKNEGEFKPFGFGANIYDLYRHSFFLKNGAVGLFARKKIDDVVNEIYELLEPSEEREEITRDKFDCDEADKISNLIADPVVRKYLKSVMPLAKERANAQTRDK